MKKLKTLFAAFLLMAMAITVPVYAQDTTYSSHTSSTSTSQDAAPAPGLSRNMWIAIGVGSLILIAGVIAAVNSRKKNDPTVSRTTTVTTTRDSNNNPPRV